MIEQTDAAEPIRERPSERRRRGELPPPRRPRVTAHRLAKFAGRIFNDSSEEEWRALAVDNWRGFMHRRFRLSEAQRTALTEIDAEAVESIANAIRELTRSGGELEAVLPDGRKNGELTFLRAEDGRSTRNSRSASKRVTIPILKCSFDANCRNWKCRVGR